MESDEVPVQDIIVNKKRGKPLVQGEKICELKSSVTRIDQAKGGYDLNDSIESITTVDDHEPVGSTIHASPKTRQMLQQFIRKRGTFSSVNERK